MEEESGDSANEHQFQCWSVEGSMWWAMVAIAVLAVASFGFAVSAIVPFGEYGKLLVFILACWLCMYLGMRMMDNPRMSHTIGSDKEEP